MQPTHTFVIPAYGRSVHLQRCLESLTAQNVPSPIIVATSTPHGELDALCSQYGAKLYTHGPNRGIAHDWNVALRQASSEWITLAHQDDIYTPEFLRCTMEAVAMRRQAILAFSDYEELDESGVRARALPLRIKRALVELGMMGRLSASARWQKTNVLRLGCAIPCPTVTLHRSVVDGGLLFDPRYRVNLDWDMWLRIAQEAGGAFVRSRRKLVYHRIHGASETSAGIADGSRTREDQELFERLWPRPIARVLSRLYSRAYRYNT